MSRKESDSTKSTLMRINRDQVYFVLVEPQTPGNIGAAARAIKTMGFRHLVLVNPANHLSEEAQWMAHASTDILKHAEVFNSLEEAIHDKYFVVGTTQRERGFHLPYFTPKELAQKIIPITRDYPVAIVFGREKTGLTNEELAHCDAISTIPAHTRHPSLNLAQAVMVYSYELFQAAYEDVKTYRWKLASHGELEALYQHMRRSLEKVHFEPIDSWENFQVRFSRLMGRAQAEKRDVRVWHKIFDSFEEYIAQLEKKLSDNSE